MICRSIGETFPSRLCFPCSSPCCLLIHEVLFCIPQMQFQYLHVATLPFLSLPQLRLRTAILPGLGQPQHQQQSLIPASTYTHKDAVCDQPDPSLADQFRILVTMLLNCSKGPWQQACFLRWPQCFTLLYSAFACQ